jgi:hypothetical protein
MLLLLPRHLNFVLPRQAVSIPVMLGLSGIILKKGANLGVKALYVVVAILTLSLITFHRVRTRNTKYTYLCRVTE